MSDTTPPPDDIKAAPVAEMIEDLNIERELQDSYLTYAMSTIVDRALPDVRDGLKPSQRRILYAMDKLNLGPRSKHVKCAKISGDTSGDYHPHGDTVIYPTLVRMGQPWSMRHPLIDPQGNFGSTDGDPPAAMRYTEARLTSVASELLADLNLDTVDFQPNYDERPGKDEPVVLPAKFPNLLVNGSTGIAVGMACNLLPHNLGEVCDAIVQIIDRPETTTQELLQIVPGPDFPTGGIVMGTDGIIEGYTTGRGKLTLRSRHHVEEHKGRHSVVIDDLPYGVIRKNIVTAVAEAAKAGRMEDISAVNDESGRKHDCRIVIDLKKGAETDVVVNQLFQFTPAQVTVSMINIAIVARRPRTLALRELIDNFVSHRVEVVTRRTRYLLKKALQKAHLLEGEIYAVVDIDEVVRLIRSSKTRDEAIEKLRERRFQIPSDHPYAPQIPQKLIDKADEDGGAQLSRVQAEAIGRLQLIQLVGLEIEKLTKEYREIVEQIEDYQRILGDDRAVLDIIREDTIELKEKYGNPRRTHIDPTAWNSASKEMLITPEDVVVTLTHAGYIKRLPVDTYRAQGRGGRGIKGGTTRDDDFLEHLFVGNTHDHLLFFTNKGRVYSQRVFDIPEGTRTSGGRSVAQLLDFQPGEKVARVLSIDDLERAEAFLLFATKNGTVKKTAMSAFANIRTNGIIAINLADDDELIGVEETSGNDEIVLGTKKGMAVRFHEDSDQGGVRAMGRVAGGVRGVRLGKDDEVVGLLTVPSDNPETDASDDGDAEGEVVDTTGPMVLVATENGFGKRTPVTQYRRTNRGGKGVKNLKMTPRNGDVVRIVCVEGNEDLMLITQKGIVIRTRVSEIGAYSRAAAGVRIMKLDNGDTLVAVAKVPADDEVEKQADTPEVSPDADDAPADDAHGQPDGEDDHNGGAE
jgi:DNA gyrase subunit A